MQYLFLPTFTKTLKIIIKTYNYMDIEEIRDKKQKMESEISVMLIKFEKETNTLIEGVSITTSKFASCMKESILVKVNVSLE